MTWIVDVRFSTHDRLRVGDLGDWRRVAVLADTADDATLAAVQLVAGVHDAMPTDALICL